MKIATLNMNGETWFSINHRPRLPKSMFDIRRIREDLTKLTNDCLEKMLERNEFDIIAVQEFVNSKNERYKIEQVINRQGYIFLAPEVGKRTHFITGFILKKCHEEYCSLAEQETEIPINRIAILEYTKREKVIFSIINMHVKNHNIKIPKANGNIILLGDMNACENKQTSNNVAVNEEFINMIIDNHYISKVPNGTYTWQSNGIDKQLDHIFISDEFSKHFSVMKWAEKDDSTNFYYDDSGFTDHSMLVWEFS